MEEKMNHIPFRPLQKVFPIFVILLLVGSPFIPNQNSETSASLVSAEAVETTDIKGSDAFLLADSPELIVGDYVDDYFIANGLIYWAKFCPQGADPGYIGYLRRKPVNGGLQLTLQETA